MQRACMFMHDGAPAVITGGSHQLQNIRIVMTGRIDQLQCLDGTALKVETFDKFRCIGRRILPAGMGCIRIDDNQFVGAPREIT